MLTDRRCAQVLLLGLTCLVLPGCAVGYLSQAARGELQLLHARQSIDRVLAAPQTPPALRSMLERSRDIRAFASRELGLPDNGSYRSYADIHRPYVVWNVVAAPPLSLRPRTWCFPVAGCVAYRGYFSERGAQRFAARRRGRGDDVLVGGVPAYSTLGHFNDPIPSSMTRYGELDLAALVFHELAHQVAYLPGDSAYNEAFAMTVEEEGVARYAAARGTPAELASWQAQRAQREATSALFGARRTQLERVYAGAASMPRKLEEKARILAALGQDIRDLERRTGVASGYGSWVDAGLTNAHVVSVATYEAEMPRFTRLLAAVNGDLPAFYARVRAEVAQRLPQPVPPLLPRRE